MTRATLTKDTLERAASITEGLADLLAAYDVTVLPVDLRARIDFGRDGLLATADALRDAAEHLALTGPKTGHVDDNRLTRRT